MSVRKALKAHQGARCEFTALVARMGSKNGWNGPEPTILLTDIRDPDGRLVADHLWFNVTKAFAALALQPGEKIRFHARAKRYVKGYRGHDWEAQLESPVQRDYKLAWPTKVARLAD